MIGKTQSYARQVNNQLVMRELREANLSATQLSERLNLSNAALSAIISSLLERGLIKVVQNEPNKCVGRHRVYYTINEAFGIILVISLSNYYSTIVISDMKNNILEKVESKINKYDIKMLYELVLQTKNILQDQKYRDVPLLGIDISVPGIVNKKTGKLYLSNRFDNDLFGEKEPIVSLFERQFDVPVKIMNDINLACIGEMHQGSLVGAENGMLVHIGEGIGSAFILNGELYEGEDGFAGEIGRMQIEFRNKIGLLEDFASIRAIKNVAKEKYGKEFQIDELVELFNNDKEIKDYVLETAFVVGTLLGNIEQLLNMKKIVISGYVPLFGDEYLKKVQEGLNSRDIKPTVEFSTLNDASIIGAIYKATIALTDKILS
ncbi:MAG: ROK family transcriptional regulator [Gammaproteobacteria bacterium]|nr:ROK family transcriptional regulator [Gammaproteobacteria bacterium]